MSVAEPDLTQDQDDTAEAPEVPDAALPEDDVSLSEDDASLSEDDLLDEDAADDMPPEDLPPPIRYPTVAIVGRPNVGKSSLLNALVRKRVAIVQDQPGVTRDRVSIPLEIDTDDGPRWVQLVDTGGYGFEDSQGLTQHIKDQVETAMKRADLMFFLLDAHTGPLAGDEMISDLLRRTGRPVVPIANKADGEKYDLNIADFSRLGFGTPMAVSATTGRNVRRIADVISENIELADAPRNPPVPDIKIAIVGKRNAGKSTLVNAIARLFNEEEGGGDRVIVSEVAGTTRDSVDVIFEKDGRTMTVIDTAGVRKKRHMVSTDVEFYSFHRAQRSVRRADVVLMLTDATLRVSEPDKKLGQYVADEMKPTIVVVNKWDLARKLRRDEAADTKQPMPRDGDLMDEYRDYLEAEVPGLAFAPIAFISANEGRNVAALLDACRSLHKAASSRIGTGELNRAIERALAARTPGGGKGGRKRPKVFYATQVRTNPPHVVLFVNDPDLFDESYRRFLINRLRDETEFGDVPMRLTLRPRRKDDETEEKTQGRQR